MNPYGCHNRPRPVAGAITHWAQAGWIESDLKCVHKREPHWVPVRMTMTAHCVVGTKPEVLKDPRCAGCKHITAVQPTKEPA